MPIRPFRSRLFSRLAALPVLLALTLAGCAEQEPRIPVIKLATWFGSSEAREMAPIVKAINARHAEEFQLELITIPGEYLTKVDTMLAGGVPPDLFLLSQEYLPSYAEIGALADLDTRIRQDEAIDLTDYYPAGLETARHHDRYYGLPWVMMPVVLYYNRALFDRAKLAYPDNTWDWARFREAARTLTKRESDGRATQWGFLQHTWPPYHIWVWQNGGEVLSKDGKKPTLTAPETQEALRFMRKLVVEDKVSPGAGTVAQNGASELFKSGRVAMFMGGASDDLDRTPGVPVGVAEPPHGVKRATFSWTAHLVMAKRTKHPDQAYVALRELLDGFHHWKIVPPRRSLAKRLPEIEPRKAAAAPAILAAMEYARGIHGVVDQTAWDSFVLDKLLLPMLDGRETADAAASQTQAKLERVMEKQQ
jgi:multiple sugar transport system substrate-binding protein